MRKKPVKKKKELNIPAQKAIWIFLSAIIGTAVCVIGTLVFSVILSKSAQLSENAGIYFIVSVVLGGLVSGTVAARKTRLKGIVAGLAVSLVYCMTVFSVMLVFSKGQLKATTLGLFAGIIASAVAGGIIGANMKRRK